MEKDPACGGHICHPLAWRQKLSLEGKLPLGGSCGVGWLAPRSLFGSQPGVFGAGRLLGWVKLRGSSPSSNWHRDIEILAPAW